jgi:hypothetical protein
MSKGYRHGFISRIEYRDVDGELLLSADREATLVCN